ncbi:MAG TPA: hypothetical protein ENK18_22800 [Deltaproteobacteria bacterium]|nr:hypothetical protein [Deltaproteobacteria bacterium]
MDKRTWFGLLGIATGCSGTPGQLDCAPELQVEVFTDADGDGFGTGEPERACGWGGGADNPLDCNDEDAGVYPGADEQCNGIDDDCNGTIDDGLGSVLFYTDADGDGFGVRYPAVLGCDDPGSGWARNHLDCDDSDARISPDGHEICNGNIDDDCDGASDDNDADTDPESMSTFWLDADADGLGDLGTPLLACSPPATYVANSDDCDDSDDTITQTVFFEDADHDGYGVPGSTVLSCEGYVGGSSNDLDCDDTDPWVNVPHDWYRDLDGDGWGNGASLGSGCFPPPGPAVGPWLGDCDETDPYINAGMLEECSDGIDQNCNGQIDCDDSDCGIDPSCLAPCADLSLDSLAPTSFSGSTIGQGNDLTPQTCASSSAPEVVLQWVAPAAGTYRINTQGSSFDTVLYAYHTCGGPEIACNDDYYGLQSRITLNLAAGEIVLIVVDGYSTSSGSFSLNILQ